jgi:hypothetical protein
VDDTRLETWQDVQQEVVKSAASAAQALHKHPELGIVAEGWPGLPIAVRRTILNLVERYSNSAR